MHFFAEGRPPKLSDWQVVYPDGGNLVLNSGVVPYDLNTPLFSDYAHKLRTVWMPAGAAAKYSADASFDFPVGTIITKTFYYPLPQGEAHSSKSVERTYDQSRDFAGARKGAEALSLANVHLIETRVLVPGRQLGGIPYVWNSSQTETGANRRCTALGRPYPTMAPGKHSLRGAERESCWMSCRGPENQGDRPHRHQGPAPQSQLRLRPQARISSRTGRSWVISGAPDAAVAKNASGAIKQPIEHAPGPILMSIAVIATTPKVPRIPLRWI